MGRRRRAAADVSRQPRPGRAGPRWRAAAQPAVEARVRRGRHPRLPAVPRGESSAAADTRRNRVRSAVHADRLRQPQAGSPRSCTREPARASSRATGSPPDPGACGRACLTCEPRERRRPAPRPPRQVPPMRHAELLEPVRQRVARLALGVSREQTERAQPVEAVAPGRERHERRPPPRRSRVADAPAGRPRFDRAQREEDERNPLDQDRKRPRRPGQSAAPGGSENERAEVSAIRSASLWPPPAKWIAKSGFQPTNAAA